MGQQIGNGLVDAATPIVGLIAGGFAATKGAHMIGVPQKWAPWGVAAIGTYAAMTGTGRVRQAAIGAAAAGVTLGILETMGMLDFLVAMPAMRQAAAMAPSTPSVPDAMTRDEVQKALTDAAHKNDARLTQLQQQQDEHLRELRRVYDGRIEQICAAYNRRLAEKDQTISELLRELRKAQAAGPTIVHRDATAPVEEPMPLEDETEASVEGETAPAEPDVMSKAQAIRALLTPNENHQLQELLAAASPETVAFAEAQIANLSAEEAVAYLREHVLASPKAA